MGSGSATAFIYCTVGNPISNSVSGSECIIFNNLLVNTGAGAHTLLWFGGNTKNNKVYNNTIVGNTTNSSFNPCIISSSLGGDVYKNNICQTWSQIFGTQWANDPAQIISESDNNVFYNIGNPTLGALQRGYTLDQWRGLGHDVKSVLADPKLDASYRLTSGSSAIGSGANLSNVGIAGLNYDKDGNARAITGAWDIGAYEYVEGRDTTPPAAPTGLSVW